MLRRIKGVTLRNREKRNENVEVDQGCDTKEQRKRNENVEVDHRCDTKEQRKRNENVEVNKDVTLRNREREIIERERERGMRMLR